METSDLEPFDEIEGFYNPLRTDDLKPGIEAFIGTRHKWLAAWIIEDGDYAGQWAMMPKDAHISDFPVGWVPLCDIEYSIAIPVEVGAGH